MRSMLCDVWHGEEDMYNEKVMLDYVHLGSRRVGWLAGWLAGLNSSSDKMFLGAVDRKN